MQSFSIVKYKEIIASFPHRSRHHINERLRKITTKEEYDKWLIDSPKIGDALVYASMKVEPNDVVIQLVTNVATEFSQVQWDNYTGYPQSHEVVAVASIAFDGLNGKFYPRFITPNEYRLVTAEEYTKAIDDKLQDNITRALEILKQTRAQSS